MGQRRTSVLFAALIVVSAVAVDPWGWDRYGPLRWGLVSTLGLAIVGLALLDRGVDIGRIGRAERWGIGLLASGTAISTALSDDLLHALIGTPDRHFGAVTWVLCLSLFVVVAAMPPDLVVVVRGAATAVTVLGVWTALELAEVSWFDSAFADGRAGGPFGQPAFLGAGAVLLTPLAAAALLDRDARRIDRRIAAVAVVAGGIALVGSGSRAAAVGAVAAAGAFVALARVRRRGWILGLIASVGVAAITPLGGRVVDTVRDGDGIVGRSDEWQVGLRALWDAPGRGTLGWGPESYRTVFGRFVDDGYVIDHGRDVITDRAHGGPLDIALSSGLVGLVGWGLLVGGVGVAVWRGERTLTTVVVATGAVGYLVQQLFLFPVAELDPVLFGLLGLLAAATSPAGSPPPRRAPFGAVAALALSVIAGLGGIADVAADRAVAASPVDAESARALRPDSIRYRFISARAEPRGDEDSLRRAIGHVADGLELSRADPALRLEDATLRTELARSTSSVVDIRAARATVAGYVEDDPRHPQLVMQAGILAALDGDLVEAESALVRAVELAPRDVEPRLNLGVVLIELGRAREARDVLDAATALDPGNAAVRALLAEISGG